MDQNKQTRTGRWKLLLVLAVCAAPLVFSYLTYYVIKPQGRNNYGTLIDPRAYPAPNLEARLLDGTPVSLERFKGKWVLFQTDGGACSEACRRKLLEMRQLRLMQGKEMERIERVWLITDDEPLDTVLMREYDGTSMIRVKPEVLKAWLPVETGSSSDAHLFMIDPMGHLMMRFPKNPDPTKVKNDIVKLLKASSIG